MAGALVERYDPSLTPVSILSFRINQVDMGILSLALPHQNSGRGVIATKLALWQYKMHLRSANCGFRAKSPKSHSSPINSFFATGCTASVRIRLALQSWPAMLLCMHSNRLGPQTVKVGSCSVIAHPQLGTVNLLKKR